MTLGNHQLGICNVLLSQSLSFDVSYAFLQQCQMSYLELLHAFSCQTIICYSQIRVYFQAVKLELKFLLLIQELLQTVGESLIGKVESAVFFVKVVVIIQVPFILLMLSSFAKLVNYFIIRVIYFPKVQCQLVFWFLPPLWICPPNDYR